MRVFGKTLRKARRSSGFTIRWPEKQRELIHKDQMLRAEDIAVTAHYMLTQPRRAAVPLIRVETHLDLPQQRGGACSYAVRNHWLFAGL